MKALKARIMQFWSSLALRNKLLTINIVLIFVPVILLDTYFFSATMYLARTNAINVLYSAQQNVVQSIQSKADAIEKMAEVLVLDEHIQSAFAGPYADEAQRVVDYQLVTGGSVGHMLKFSPDVNAIYIYNDKLVICEMMDSFFSVQKELMPDAFAAMKLRYPHATEQWNMERDGLHNVHRPSISPKYPVSFQYSVVTAGGRRSAVLEIVCDKDTLLSAMYEQDLLAGGYSVIADKDGKVLYSTQLNQKSSVQELGFEDFEQGKIIQRVGSEALQIALPIENLGVSLVTSVPLKGLYSSMYRNAVTVVVLSAASLWACCMLFSFFAQRQLKPIPPMMRAMHQIRKGDFSTRVPDEGGDELSALAKDFNYMSEKLQAQVNKVYIAGQMEREAELRALAANINPHFLYNSLATITWMARAKNSPEIVMITEALARLYRMVLSDGRSILAFSEEMEIVSAYLKVQQIRFEDKCKVIIDVSEEAMAFPIIKNVVQPLVENALEHGIGAKLGTGCVTVSAHVEEDKLIVCVTDDGVGMSEERRLEVVRGLQSGGKKRGYAIRNIQDRLKVFYEGRYEFSLHSDEGVGTTVRMVLPRPKKIWKDDEEHV